MLSDYVNALVEKLKCCLLFNSGVIPCVCEYYFYLSVGVYRLYTECECVDTADNLGDTLSGNITDVVLLCLHTCNDTCKVTSLIYLTEVG